VHTPKPIIFLFSLLDISVPNTLAPSIAISSKTRPMESYNEGGEM